MPEITIKDSEDKDHVVTTEEYTKLVESNAALTKDADSVKDISEAVKRYGGNTEDFLANTEGAFGVVSSLIDEGVLDESGTLIKKGEEIPKEDKTTLSPEILALLNPTKVPVADSKDKTMEIVAKVIQTSLGGVAKQIEDLQQGQTGLIRKQLTSDIQKKHPTLDSKDVTEVFRIAATNSRKNLFEHAADLAGTKLDNGKEQRENYAKEFGIDLAAFDQNKLHEQDAKGGTIPEVKGKKILFPRRAQRLKQSSEKSISPRQAMVSFLTRSSQ